jgi:hypothetical protein
MKNIKSKWEEISGDESLNKKSAKSCALESSFVRSAVQFLTQSFEKREFVKKEEEEN